MAMNYKRASIFGLLLWISIFVVISILMFIPFLHGKDLFNHVVYWILLVPIVMLLSKWYFKGDSPKIKKGFFLGVFALFIGTILDLVITVPFFVKSYTNFYGDWKLWIGFAIVVLTTTFAGFEFDATYSKREE